MNGPGPIAPRRRRRRLLTEITLRHRIRTPLVTIAGVMAIGTLGFRLIEKQWTLRDSLYMTIVTISTVSHSGHWFAMILIVLGMTVVAFSIYSFTQLVVEGTFLELMGERRLGRELDRLENHIIVCGAGRIGKLVAEDLLAAGVEFVLIDSDQEQVRELLARDILAIHGSAGDEEVLTQARIEHASTLISVVRSDADNLYITMTARSMNPRIYLVVRAEDASTVNKLRRVGANKVVAPYHLGAMRIASAVLRPAITDVMELTSGAGENALGLQMSEVRLSERSRLCGQTLRGAALPQQLGIIVIAVRSTEGKTTFNPGSEYLLQAGSLVVAIGTQDQLDHLQEWAKV